MALGCKAAVVSFAADSSAQGVVAGGHAEGRPGRVAVIASGAPTTDVLKSVRASLPSGLVVVDAAHAEAAVKANPALTKLKLPLDDASIAALKSVGTSEGVDAYVVVSVQTTPHARQVSMEVYDLSRPEPYMQHAVRLGARPAASDTAKLASVTRVLKGLEAPRAPVAPAAIAAPAALPVGPAAATTVVPSAAPPLPGAAVANARAEGDPAYSLASVDIAADVGTRNFSYHDGISSNLRPYAGAAAPGLAVGAELYPFAETANYVLESIGVKADYRAAVGLASRAATGGTVDTAWSSFDILLRYRIRLAAERRAERPPVLGLVFGYSREEFVFALPVAAYPSAAYPALRMGLDFRLPFGRSAVTASGDYLAVLNVVDVGTNFTSPSDAGADAAFRYSYQVAPLVEVFAQGSMTRYFYTFVPRRGDAWVAGGAVDQMFHGQVGLRATY